MSYDDWKLMTPEQAGRPVHRGPPAREDPDTITDDLMIEEAEREVENGTIQH